MAAATTMEWIMPRGAAEASVQLGVGLGVWGISGTVEVIQEVGCRNCPPRLINLLFLKSVQLYLGVVGMSDPVSICL